jgi:hypothetical protein
VQGAGRPHHRPGAHHARRIGCIKRRRPACGGLRLRFVGTPIERMLPSHLDRTSAPLVCLLHIILGSDYSESSHSRMVRSRLHRGSLPALDRGLTWALRWKRSEYQSPSASSGTLLRFPHRDTLPAGKVGSIFRKECRVEEELP